MRRGSKKEQRERARQLALFGSAASVVALLKTAAETLAREDVSAKKVRISADIVMRACDKAIFAVAGPLVHASADGSRVMNGATLRDVRRASDAFTRIAQARLERRQMYCAEFVASRLMACHLAVNALRMRHRDRLGKEFKKLDDVAATLLGKVLKGLGEHEPTMYEIAEAFTEEVFVS